MRRTDGIALLQILRLEGMQQWKGVMLSTFSLTEWVSRLWPQKIAWSLSQQRRGRWSQKEVSEEERCEILVAQMERSTKTEIPQAKSRSLLRKEHPRQWKPENRESWWSWACHSYQNLRAQYRQQQRQQLQQVQLQWNKTEMFPWSIFVPFPVASRALFRSTLLQSFHLCWKAGHNNKELRLALAAIIGR